MTLMSRGALTFALILTCLTPALAEPHCKKPGTVLHLPTPDYLKPGRAQTELPDLYLETSDGRKFEVKPVSLTQKRLKVMIPASFPFDTRYRLRQHSDHGNHDSGHGGSDDDGAADGTTPGNGGGHGGAGLDKTLSKGETCARAVVPGGRDLTKAPRKPKDKATKNDVAAPSGAPEVVLIGSATAVSKAEAVVMSAGGAVLRSNHLANMGLKVSAVDIGGAMSVKELKAELARKAVAVAADRHSVYSAAQGPSAYAWPMVGVDPASPCHLPRTVRIGIIDGPIDDTNAALQGVAIRSFSALEDGDLSGSTDHATGIASLIAGNGTTDLPAGLAQGAEIYSVVAFAKAGGRDVARLESIAKALDWMIGANVKVVNLSLAGPQNDALADIVRKADEAGMILVAAAGNGGQSAISYPASDDRVIGVTAVDAAGRLYRKANTGAGIDFAAPGVDVLVADRSGLGIRSGTSYAAAIATGIVAQQAARGMTSRSSVMSALQSNVEDLGDSGRDEKFGWGLIHLNGC